jgi:hypothetical protein
VVVGGRSPRYGLHHWGVDPVAQFEFSAVHEFWTGQGRWQPVTHACRPRLMAGVVRDALGGLVAIGGMNEEGEPTDSVERFDGRNGVWSPLPSLGKPRSCAGAACDGRGTLHCVGGGESMYAHAQVYASAEMLTLGSTDWRAAPAMNHPRCGAGVAVSYERDELIACGGYGGCAGDAPYASGDGRGVYLDTAERLHLSSEVQQWEDLPRMHERRAGAQAAVGPDGRLYVIGGGPDGQREHSSMEALDLRTCRWDGSLPAANVGRHYNAAAFAPDGSLYVSGSFRHMPEGQLDEVERYDVRARRWERLPNVGEVVLFSAGAVIW